MNSTAFMILTRACSRGPAVESDHEETTNATVRLTSTELPTTWAGHSIHEDVSNAVIGHRCSPCRAIKLEDLAPNVPAQEHMPPSVGAPGAEAASEHVLRRNDWK